MSIASRLNEITEHLEDDYDVLTLAGADLTNVDKNIINLKPTWKERLLYFMNNGTDVVWNNWEKVVGEGTELTLSNTEQAPMKVLLKGNTYQYSTTGKNLWGGFSNSIACSNGGISYVSNENGTISASGTATTNSQSITATQATDNNWYITLSAGTYTLSGGISTVKQLEVRNINNTSIGFDNGSGFTFTLNEETGIYIRVFISSGTALSGTEVFKPMIEKNNTKTSYEPYTNGASPNPDYPQEVHTVSGDNEVEVVGKNYLNKNDIVANNPSKTTITYLDTGVNIKNIDNGYGGKIQIDNLQKNTDYYISYNWKNISDGINIVYVFAGTTTTTQLGHLDNGSGFTFNTVENTTINIWFYAQTNSIAEVEYTDIQLEKGTSKTSYQSYQALTTYPINLPEGMFLGSISTYEDRIFKNETTSPYYDNTLELNAWYLKKEIGKYTLQSNIGGYNSSANWYYFGITNLSIDINTTTLVCNYFKYYEHLVSGETTQGIGYSSNYSNLLIRNNNLSSKEDYQTWLSTNQPIMYYVLATPTYTKIEGTLASQLEEVYRAKSKEGQTNISQTNDDLPFVLSVSALKQI